MQKQIQESTPSPHRKIFLLRATHQVAAAKALLAKTGAAIQVCPMIDFKANPAELAKITPELLAQVDLVIFTSQNAVRFFMEDYLAKNPSGMSLLASKHVLCVGPKTQQQLQRYGLTSDSVSQQAYSQEGLVATLGADLSNRSILLPLAEEARDFLPDELQKRGAKVHKFNIYSSYCPELTEPVLLQDKDIVLFTSSLIAKHFFASPFYKGQKIIAFCIGKQTYNNVLKVLQDSSRVFISSESTMESLVHKVQSVLELAP